MSSIPATSPRRPRRRITLGGLIVAVVLIAFLAVHAVSAAKQARCIHMQTTPMAVAHITQTCGLSGH